MNRNDIFRETVVSNKKFHVTKIAVLTNETESVQQNGLLLPLNVWESRKLKKE